MSLLFQEILPCTKEWKTHSFSTMATLGILFRTPSFYLNHDLYLQTWAVDYWLCNPARRLHFLVYTIFCLCGKVIVIKICGSIVVLYYPIEIHWLHQLVSVNLWVSVHLVLEEQHANDTLWKYWRGDMFFFSLKQ